MLSCNTYRQSKQAKKLYDKVKSYRHKLDDIKEVSQNEQKPHFIWVGSRAKCSRQQVDGVEWYSNKLKKAIEEWETAKASYKSSNEGVVFVVFKSADSVQETIDELEIVKSRLVGKAHFDRLHVKAWTISPGLPSHDIIWPNVSRIFESAPLASLYASTAPAAISIVVISAILYTEYILMVYLPTYAVYLLYLTTCINVVYNAYGVPYLIFHYLQNENHYLKSVREAAYMRRLCVTLMCNMLIVPIVCTLIVAATTPSIKRNLQQPDTILDNTSNWVQLSSLVICYSEEYFVR